MSFNPIKRAAPARPIVHWLADRYSPYVFEPRTVEREKLLTCLEAARWSASSYNEQPWRYILAVRENPSSFEQALSCLTDSNQAWARDAGVLLLGLSKRTFSMNGKPNRVYEHDLGLAGGNFTVQATALGLHVHMMAGILPSRIRAIYHVPEDFEPLTGIALGYAADPEAAGLNPELAARDKTARARKAINEFVYGADWGLPSGLVP